MQKEDLTIIFMGTPEFAVETLRALVENKYNVVAVVTQPDKPVGRHGSVLQPSPVKQYAIEHGLPVLQPEKMKDPQFVETLRSYKCNLQIVVAFRMLPEVIWSMPKYGTFNVHASLLPQYRGAAPINWAVINGETKTGVTTFFLDRDIDTGRVIDQIPFAIPDEADVEYVYEGLMSLGAKICLSTLNKIITSDGYPESEPQEEPLNIHHAPKIFKETCKVDWNQPAKKIYDFVRGLSPYPGAWTSFNTPQGEMILKVFRTKKTEHLTEDAPGRLMVEGKRLFVACKDSWLEIKELQLAGKKRMDAVSFLNGNHDIENYSLG